MARAVADKRPDAGGGCWPPEPEGFVSVPNAESGNRINKVFRVLNVNARIAGQI